MTQKQVIAVMDTPHFDEIRSVVIQQADRVLAAYQSVPVSPAEQAAYSNLLIEIVKALRDKTARIVELSGSDTLQAKLLNDLSIKADVQKADRRLRRAVPETMQRVL